MSDPIRFLNKSCLPLCRWFSINLKNLLCRDPKTIIIVKSTSSADADRFILLLICKMHVKCSLGKNICYHGKVTDLQSQVKLSKACSCQMSILGCKSVLKKLCHCRSKKWKWHHYNMMSLQRCIKYNNGAMLKTFQHNQSFFLSYEHFSTTASDSPTALAPVLSKNCQQDKLVNGWC